ncbi:LemA family protein [uncultured Vagococcus sp.]|uniref:LemA family protein n=1 Tax=uncultured Vagococcus sp. TaxID=189676 RepID=UPI0028D748C8|nr:LemA family protein [uncultured Vagococcus sp.]
MKAKKTTGLLVVVLVVIALIVASVVSYNGIISKEAEVESQWANVESKLQRRYDLVPNLVNAVKGSMAHEEKVLTSITEARTKMAGAKSVKDVSTANTAMEGALSQLLVVMENYPELKSNENVKTLMTQLEGSENRISVERDRYNTAVKEYNVTIKKFPKSIFAKMAGFDQKVFFEADKEAESAPVVDLEN